MSSDSNFLLLALLSAKKKKKRQIILVLERTSDSDGLGNETSREQGTVLKAFQDQEKQTNLQIRLLNILEGR